MKRNLLVILVMPLVLAAAVFAGLKTSSAQSSACGPGGSGTGGSGTGGSGTGGSGTGGSGTGGSGTGGSGTGGSGTGCDCASPYLSVPDRLYGVAGTSASDVWAVGLQPTSSLIMHWNGCAWSVSYNRPVGYFASVSAVSRGDAWAVGGTSWWNPSQTLAEHWNGKSWTRVSTPTPGGSAVFAGVAAMSATSGWAVGRIGPGPGVQSASAVPLIERWSDSTWSVQQFQEPSDGGQFQAVAATSADDAWAVGWAGGSNGSTAQTLIEHWNGSTWATVPCPDPGTSAFLTGTTVISPDDAWAVGYFVSSSGTDESLTLHWDGSTWTQVTSPNPTGDTILDAVAAATADDVWAVGYTNPTRCSNGGPKCQGVIMHWDGTGWTVIPSPNPPSRYLNDYLGVTALPGQDAWAVGTTDFAWTLIAHWNGTAWS